MMKKRFGGFEVNGKPFFPLGAQSHNSSSYDAEMFREAVRSTLAINCNTIEAPVYWEKIEPEEGVFEFSMVKNMVEICRENDLKLIILWFASWKNGEMSYCPEYIKRDTARFQRVIGADGVPVTDLSVHYVANCEADANAFTKLIAYIRTIDEAQHTILAVQVENEPGYLRTDRDYTPSAIKNQNASVPADLLAYLQTHQHGAPYRDWEKHGFEKEQDWFTTFGIYGYEYCEAWHLAHYVDSVAAAGKAVYDIPMYINVWLTGDVNWIVPGLEYPGGGAVERTLDVWLCAVQHLDMIAPDIYERNSYRFQHICDVYSRDHNALFVPESSRALHGACNMFYAIASGAVGYACFGVEDALDKNGEITDECRAIADSNAVVRNAMPLILKHRNTGGMYSVLQHDGETSRSYEFDHYIGCVQFSGGNHARRTDYHTRRNPGTMEMQTPRGLIFEDDPKTFFLAGNYHLRMVEKSSPAWGRLDRYMPMVDCIAVEEGIFNEKGIFHVTRIRNGDEVIFGGFWVTPACGIVRVRLL